MGIGFKNLCVVLAMMVLPAMVQAAEADASDAQKVVQASADQKTLDSVRQLFESRFPGIEVEAVTTTPFPGLFEIQMGMDLLLMRRIVAT